MPDKIRAFIAIDFTAELKEGLSRIQEELKESNVDVKWVNPKNIHLTLKFLGYLKQEQVEKVKQIIENIAKSYSKFEISTSKIRCFPEKGTPRVVWIGIENGSEILKKIAKALEEKIQKLGIPEEGRAFQSHATIGRVKSPKKIVGAEYYSALREKINEINPTINPQNQIIKAIVLFQSTLTPKGPLYKELSKTELNN